MLDFRPFCGIVLACRLRLQSSLNFEQGGEIADNLFRLYEYARQQLLSASRTNDSAGTHAAIAALQDIRDAWSQIESANKQTS